MLYFSSDKVISLQSSFATGRGKVVGLRYILSKPAVRELGSPNGLICGWQGAVCWGGSSSSKYLYGYKLFYFVVMMGTTIQCFAGVCGKISLWRCGSLCLIA